MAGGTFCSFALTTTRPGDGSTPLFLPLLQLRPSPEVAAQHRARRRRHAVPPLRAPRPGQAAQEVGEGLHTEARHLCVTGGAVGPGE